MSVKVTGIPRPRGMVIGARIATEVAVFGVVAGEDAWCCGPMVNFSYAFGH